MRPQYYLAHASWEGGGVLLEPYASFEDAQKAADEALADTFDVTYTVLRCEDNLLTEVASRHYNAGICNRSGNWEYEQPEPACTAQSTDYHVLDETNMWWGTKFTRLPDAQQYHADLTRLYPDKAFVIKDDWGNVVEPE